MKTASFSTLTDQSFHRGPKVKTVIFVRIYLRKKNQLIVSSVDSGFAANVKLKSAHFQKQQLTSKGDSREAEFASSATEDSC